MTIELLGDGVLTPSKGASFGIVALSHLRWNFVWQRPQQFLSRFAEWHPVLFIEEPVWDLPRGEDPSVRVERVAENVHTAVPRLPEGFEATEDTLLELARGAIEAVNLKGEFNEPLLWFYSPMMAEWALGLPSRGVVYDCMDELSQFRGAPSGLVRNEERLLSNADVVFTGGYELFEKKSKQHGNTHCFGCGVEYEHFAKAQDSSKPIPKDVASMRRPIVGWFGVIDERVDYELLSEAARLRPDVSFVMVGPVVKVDPDTLPKAQNLYWLGGRDYKELPDYCRAFDVCMMCFALNEATEYINPTKALEYLATGRPVISTPVRDVVRQYRDTLTIVNGPQEFVDAIDRLTRQPDVGALRAGIDRARAASWDETVSQMRGIIEQTLGARHVTGAGREALAATTL